MRIMVVRRSEGPDTSGFTATSYGAAPGRRTQERRVPSALSCPLAVLLLLEEHLRIGLSQRLLLFVVVECRLPLAIDATAHIARTTCLGRGRQLTIIVEAIEAAFVGSCAGRCPTVAPVGPCSLDVHCKRRV